MKPAPPKPAQVHAALARPRGDSFADVKRACHAWLMKKDPSYRRACEQYAEHSPAARETQRRANKFAGFYPLSPVS